MTLTLSSGWSPQTLLGDTMFFSVIYVIWSKLQFLHVPLIIDHVKCHVKVMHGLLTQLTSHEAENIAAQLTAQVLDPRNIK